MGLEQSELFQDENGSFFQSLSLCLRMKMVATYFPSLLPLAPFVQGRVLKVLNVDGIRRLTVMCVRKAKHRIRLSIKHSQRSMGLAGIVENTRITTSITSERK